MNYRDFAAGLVVLMISIVLVYYALDLPKGLSSNGVLQPGTFPIVIASGLFLLSILLIGNSLKGIREFRFRPKRAELLQNLRGSARVWLAFAGMFALFIAVNKLGFLVSVALFTFITAKFYFKHKWLFSAVVACVIALGAYWVFESFLGIGLPTGLLI